MELKRRNVLRAAVLYAGAVWALAQGIAQLGPVFGAPDWATRGFVIAAAFGFPFWIAFAWIFEITPQGITRGSDVTPDESIARQTGRKLDFAIIAVLAVAVILLLGNQFLWHKGIASPVTSIAKAVAVIPQKSVAVLPFSNESGKPDEQFFSDGLSEDLITALSQFAGLKVISRNSAFQFRESKEDAKTIGDKLGVAHLLEGSVRRLGGEVRISAELVNAPDGSTLWSQHYDRPYEDLFALQDDITHAVAEALEAKLLMAPGAVVQSDRPPSGNLVAYAAYLQGKANGVLATTRGKRAAVADFQQAIRLDPNYALAYAALSQWWVGTYSMGHTPADGPQDIARARAAIRTALALDPNLAAAHAAHGLLLYSIDFDWQGAEAEYRHALQLAPNVPMARAWLGDALATLGQNHAAIALRRAALEVDPRDAPGWKWLGATLIAAGQFDAAEQAIRNGIALSPDMGNTFGRLAVIEVLRGNPELAMAYAHEEPFPAWRHYAVAIAAQIGPDRTAADAALRDLIGQDADTSAYQVAEVYALRKDPDRMFKWLARAGAQRDSGIEELLSDPLILRYQHDPRFAAFCKKVGLPTTTDAVAMR